MGTRHMADYYQTIPGHDPHRLRELQNALPADPASGARRQAALELVEAAGQLAAAEARFNRLHPGAADTSTLQTVLGRMSQAELHRIAGAASPDGQAVPRRSKAALVAAIARNRV